MEAKLALLKERLSEIEDLSNVNLVLGWDQNTYMPSGGADARGRQMATVGRLLMEKSTDPTLGNLIDELLPFAESLAKGNDDRALIEVAKRDFERNTRVPPTFYAKMLQHQAKSFQTWAEARPKNDFKAVEGLLERTLELSRELAQFFPGYEHIADPLIDFSDYGMKVSSVRGVFHDLRRELVPLVEAITAHEQIDDSCLKQYYPESEQLAFADEVITRMGYDFDRGRNDKTHHPFTTRFSIGDVRITTRVRENDFTETFFSTVHEGGHAMYEQGVNPLFEGTPLASGTSSGVHESQSRLWENVVARSYPFWKYYFPIAQKRFTSQLANVSLNDFYRAINKVQRSLIRTDADEVTYNLHVMIRFDLEIQLLEGALEIRHLPEAWNERYRSDLGVVPASNADGCMQDVHWYAGTIGGSFQGYTLGNILSCLFFSRANQDYPIISSEIEQGEFTSLHRWMREHIYTHGRKYTASELVEQVTGGSLRIGPYIEYLKSKYGEIYRL